MSCFAILQHHSGIKSTSLSIAEMNFKFNTNGNTNSQNWREVKWRKKLKKTRLFKVNMVSSFLLRIGANVSRALAFLDVARQLKLLTQCLSCGVWWFVEVGCSFFYFLLLNSWKQIRFLLEFFRRLLGQVRLLLWSRCTNTSSMFIRNFYQAVKSQSDFWNEEFFF